MIERPKVLPETPASAGDLLSDLLGSMHRAGTVLADRFRRLLDPSPMHYLAGRAGYASEAAFSRAFKRRFGLPPGEWRRQQPGHAHAGQPPVGQPHADRASASAGP